MTVNDACPVLFEWSVALHVTVVCWTRKPEPEGGAHDTGRLPSTASSAEAEKVTVVVGPVALTFIGPGTVTTGGVVSTKLTVTWKLAEP